MRPSSMATRFAAGSGRRMKISTRTEYGIRVLVTLGKLDPDDACLSLTEIAKREKLPHAYLEQLVGDLRRPGLVSATPGTQRTHDRRTRHLRARGEHRGEEDSQGARPDRASGRGPRPHGAERLRQ